MITHGKPNVTIFTDASVLHKHRVAGWGGWARGDGRGAVLHDGPVPFSANSTIAEAWAIALMIEHLVNTRYLTENDERLLIQSDSLQALEVLNHALPNSHATCRSETGSVINRAKSIPGNLHAPINRIAQHARARTVVYLRHVKGHMGGKNARSWVNEQCDTRARAAARAQIHQPTLP